MSLRNKFSIGRSRKCHLILNDKSVSSIHAEITFTKDGHIKMRDLGSLNGTYRQEGENFVRISDSYVSPTDVVRFGSSKMLVKDIVEALHMLTPPATKFPGGGGGGPERKIVKGKRLVRCKCGNVKSPGKPCNVCGSVTTRTYK